MSDTPTTGADATARATSLTAGAADGASIDTELARAIVTRLDLVEKVRLLSGASMWTTEGVEGAPGVLLANGPNGVGKQIADADHVGVGETVPATCFPAGAVLGSTWDEDLLEEVGAAMGREARAEGVGVLLGPGLNLKRHPGGGRVFEYLSEDPYLSGKSAAALVRGVQSQGVGASVKHFAGNNQETSRMRLESVIDERTLRELYLRGFEIAVREGRPWTVMTSYNLLNGEHTGESKWLIDTVLRGEWGFDGLTMTDWMATFDRPEGIRAGLDLEMPGGAGLWDARVIAAVESGSLPEATVDRAAERVVALSLRSMRANADAAETAVDRNAHHALARRAAAAGTVLLTNDGLLPLQATGRIALIGAVAEQPRFQGVGSARVNAWRVDSILDVMRARVSQSAELVYAPGYDATSATSTDTQRREAIDAAASADVAVLVIGIPAGVEAEGVDRQELTLPTNLGSLLRAVVAANSRTVVVLINGAPLEITGGSEPAALLETYLGGQAAGAAIVDVIFGDAEPGGRLAESIPLRASDLAASANFPVTTPTQSQYREMSSVGYRFHDTWGVAPRYPFGHGLSYTRFSYGQPEIAGDGVDIEVRIAVTNTGDRAGAEVVQLYVHSLASSVHRAEQELRAFARLHLQPGETGIARLQLDRRSFAIYDVASAGWAVEAGTYELRVGASSRDVRARVLVDLDSDDAVTPVTSPRGPVATTAEFAELFDGRIPTARPVFPYTVDSTVDDLRHTWLGRRLRTVLLAGARRQLPVGGGDDIEAMVTAVLRQMPLRGLIAALGGKVSLDTLDRIVKVLNSATARRHAD